MRAAPRAGEERDFWGESATMRAALRAGVGAPPACGGERDFWGESAWLR
jgi:hypothetical protein